MSAIPLHDDGPDEIDATDGFTDPDAALIAAWDEVEIDRVLARLASLRRDAAEVDRIADERIADIEAWREARQAILAGAIDHRLGFLQAWHEHLLAEDPRRKSVSLPSGTLKSRAQGERIEVVDSQDFVGWAQEHCPELVREVTKIEPAKKELPGPLRVAQTTGGPVVVDPSTGEPVPGVVWHAASRTFQVVTD